MIKLITVIIQIIYMLLKGKVAKDKMKEKLAKEAKDNLKDAFKEKDKELRAVKINAVVNDINIKLRKA